jgi:hypothetical protein
MEQRKLRKLHNNSRKLRLRCGCQFPRCVHALTLYSWTHNCTALTHSTQSKSKSKSKSMSKSHYDWRSLRQSWPDIYYCLTVTVLFLWGAPCGRLSHIALERTYRKHIRCPEIDIRERYRKLLFLYCFIYSALHSNESYPIVACVFVVAWMCLPSRCLEMGLHVTVFKKPAFQCLQ